MSRVITGTVSVDNAGTTVTLWDGDPLSAVNAPDDSPIVIEGFANFLASRNSTTSFELAVPHAGAGGADLNCAISAMTPAEVSASTLNARTASVIQQLSVLDANGRGLFFNLIGVTGDNDPGPGNIALDNADPTLVTAAYLDLLDANDTGRDVSGIIGLWGGGTTLVVRSIATNAYAVYQMTEAATDKTGYFALALQYVGHDGSLANEPLAIEWRIPGSDLQIDQAGSFAGRDAYDDEALGFTYASVDGAAGAGAPTVLYRKQSAISGDWSVAIPFQGPTGAPANLMIGDVVTVDANLPAGATLTGTAPNYTLSFEIPMGEIGINWQGAYDAGTTYAVRDGVLYNGSSWRALQATTGNPPPDLPTTSNAYWQLIARAGVDGAGTVSSVAAGTGISIDNTDPTAPAVSAVIANQAEAEAGSLATKLMTPERVAQAIAVLAPSPEGYDEIIAQFMMELADLRNAAFIAGPTGNRFADSFDTLDYVDDAGATNLDTSTAGTLKPDITPTLISQGTGTAFGDLTSAGGLAAAFDGNKSQSSASDAALGNSGTGYVGKNYSGAPKVIAQAGIWGTSNTGYSNATVTANLRGKNGSPPANSADGTLLGSIAGITDLGTVDPRTITSLSSAAWDYVWVEITGSGTFITVSEVEFSEAVTQDLIVASVDIPSAAAPAAMLAWIVTNEVDTAAENVDFTLRLGRDGGTTLTAATLTELFTFPDGRRIYATDEIDVSGQPSGTEPCIEFATSNGTMVQCQAWALYWS